MRSALLLLLLPSLCWAGALTAKDGRFVDGMGATVILRGVNVAGDSKVPPFRPAMDPTIFDPLPKWGLNVVRLLFTWEAYELQAGQYDDSYLDYYKSAVEAAWARGIYVLVDFHQDGFSRWLIGGCGEGFPQWAIPAGVTLTPPDNGADCANWGSRVLSDDDLHTTWAALYTDSDGARARYLLMIGRVAAALASEPGVLGYDLLNEPFGDEVVQIAPFYEMAAPVIRAADPTAIIFESPQVLTSGGVMTNLPKPTFDNVVYAPHYYDPGLFLYQGWSGIAEEPFRFMTSTAAAWGAPLFLGEFGAPTTTDDLQNYLDTLYAHLDGALASGAQWAYTPGWTPALKDGWDGEDFSIVDDTGALRANFRPRPFARRVAGLPTSLSLVGDDLLLQWQNDPAAGETEIFAPIIGSVETSGDVKCKRSGDLISCSAATSGDKMVRIKKATPSCGLTGAESLLIYFLWLLWSRRASSQPRPKRWSGSR